MTEKSAPIALVKLRRGKSESFAVQAFCIIVVFAWILVFLIGITISSKPYRDAIAEGHISWKNLGMTLIAYTVTNAAVLSIISGIAGSLARIVVNQSIAKKAAAMQIDSDFDYYDEQMIAGLFR